MKELVVGVDILQQLALFKIAHAAGGASGIQLMAELVGAKVEVVVVLGLVDAHAPEDNGGVVAVLLHHLADIVDRHVLPGLIAYVLPTGELRHHQQAELVALVQEVLRLRIVRGAHGVDTQLLL